MRNGIGLSLLLAWFVPGLLGANEWIGGTGSWSVSGNWSYEIGEDQNGPVGTVYVQEGEAILTALTAPVLSTLNVGTYENTSASVIVQQGGDLVSHNLILGNSSGNGAGFLTARNFGSFSGYQASVMAGGVLVSGTGAQFRSFESYGAMDKTLTQVENGANFLGVSTQFFARGSDSVTRVKILDGGRLNTELFSAGYEPGNVLANGVVELEVAGSGSRLETGYFYLGGGNISATYGKGKALIKDGGAIYSIEARLSGGIMFDHSDSPILEVSGADSLFWVEAGLYIGKGTAVKIGSGGRLEAGSISGGDFYLDGAQTQVKTGQVFEAGFLAASNSSRVDAGSLKTGALQIKSDSVISVGTLEITGSGIRDLVIEGGTLHIDNEDATVLAHSPKLSANATIVKTNGEGGAGIIELKNTKPAYSPYWEIMNFDELATVSGVVRIDLESEGNSYGARVNGAVDLGHSGSSQGVRLANGEMYLTENSSLTLRTLDVAALVGSADKPAELYFSGNTDIYVGSEGQRTLLMVGQAVLNQGGGVARVHAFSIQGGENSKIAANNLEIGAPEGRSLYVSVGAIDAYLLKFKGGEGVRVEAKEVELKGGIISLQTLGAAEEMFTLKEDGIMTGSGAIRAQDIILSERSVIRPDEGWSIELTGNGGLYLAKGARMEIGAGSAIYVGNSFNDIEGTVQLAGGSLSSTSNIENFMGVMRGFGNSYRPLGEPLILQLSGGILEGTELDKSLRIYGTVSGNGIIRGNVQADSFLPASGQAVFNSNYNLDGGTATVLSEGSALFNQGLNLGVNGVLIAPNGVTVSDASQLSGSGLINANVIVNGTLAPGNSPGKIDVEGDLSLASTSILVFELGSNLELYDSVHVSDHLTLDGMLNIQAMDGFGAGSYTLFTYGGSFTDLGLHLGILPDGFLYSFDSSNFGGVKLVVTPIPEPSTYLMLGLGLGTLALFYWRRLAFVIPKWKFLLGIA